MKSKNTIHANAMIVEDEEDLCFLLERILRKENLQTACAHTLSEATKTISTFNPGILFVDNNLPDGYATDFIKQVKSMSPTTKVIMITAYDTQPEVERAFRKGADYFISKPFNVRTIKDVLTCLQLGNTA